MPILHDCDWCSKNNSNPRVDLFILAAAQTLLLVKVKVKLRFSAPSAGIAEYALSTKRCLLGNQDRSLARVVLFLLCWPILSPLEVVSRAVYGDFTQLNEVRNFSRVHSTFLATFSSLFGGASL